MTRFRSHPPTVAIGVGGPPAVKIAEHARAARTAAQARARELSAELARIRGQGGEHTQARREELYQLIAAQRSTISDLTGLINREERQA